MKTAIIILALIALSSAGPQPRKLFHEHFEDFLGLVEEEAGHEIEHIMGHYLEYDEFRVSFDYVRTADFRELVYEMESLPEFKAVIEYLEKDNIDVMYFIDRFNDMIDNIPENTKKSRHELSGTNFAAFINDVIDLLPKQKLNALYEEKMSEDTTFKAAMENLESDEWLEIYDNLWNSELFLNEVQTLKDNGIDIDLLLLELKALFGQN